MSVPGFAGPTASSAPALVEPSVDKEGDVPSSDIGTRERLAVALFCLLSIAAAGRDLRLVEAAKSPGRWLRCVP